MSCSNLDALSDLLRQIRSLQRNVLDLLREIFYVGNLKSHTAHTMLLHVLASKVSLEILHVTLK